MKQEVAVPIDEEIIVRSLKYRVLNIGGEIVLKRYDTEFKAWVTLRFAKDDSNDEEITRNVSRMVLDILTS